MEKGIPEGYIAQEAGSAARDATNNATKSVFFDKGMIKTKEVILKFAEVLVCLIGNICVACAFNTHVAQASFFEFVASTGIVMAIILALLYIFHLREKFASRLPVTQAELVYSAIWCFFFFAASTACIVHGSSYMYQEPLIAAGFFGYIAMVLYGIDAFLLFHAWRTDRTMAGQQSVQQVTTPAY